MDNDYTPKVMRVTEDVQLQPDSTVVKMVHVQYTIGTHGPFMADFASKDFTADAARAEMQKRADQLRQLGS